MNRVEAYLIYDEQRPVIDLAYECNIVDIIPIIIDEDYSLNSIELYEGLQDNDYVREIVSWLQDNPKYSGFVIAREQERYNATLSLLFGTIGTTFTEYTKSGEELFLVISQIIEYAQIEDERIARKESLFKTASEHFDEETWEKYR